MRDDVFEFEDIYLIAGGISLQRGKLPEHVITLADEWLLRASKFERHALRARSLRAFRNTKREHLNRRRCCTLKG